MAELKRDFIKYLQHVHNIGHETPVPLLDLRQDLVVILELLSSLHIHQGRLQDNKTFKHEVGRVPPGRHILPEEVKINTLQNRA